MKIMINTCYMSYYYKVDFFKRRDKETGKYLFGFQEYGRYNPRGTWEPASDEKYGYPGIEELNYACYEHITSHLEDIMKYEAC